MSQTIIQHVVPGSPAFVAGFFPGDQIVAVNRQDLKNASVKEVANAIQQADPNRQESKQQSKLLLSSIMSEPFALIGSVFLCITDNYYYYYYYIGE